MTDLASLSLKIDSSDVPQGVRELDKLTAAGTKAEKAVEQLGNEAAQTGKQIKTASQAAAEMAAEAQRAASAATKSASGIGGVGNQSRLASHHVQNLAFQFNDMAVALASGQKPLTVFLQQGSQIAGVMAQAGIGVKGLTKEVGGMVIGFARAHPLLVALVAAAGAAGGAFKLFQSEIGQTGELDKFVATLGLTKKEMEELGPVTITLGDVFRGLWKTIDEGLGLSKVFTAIKNWSVDAFTTALNIGKVAAAGIYAAFVGTYNGIAAIWPKLPQIIGEASIAAANAGIAAIESMVNRAITAINALAKVTNPLLAAAEMVGINTNIPSITLGRLQNVYAGAGKSAAGAFTDAYGKAFGEAISGMDRLGKTLTDNIVGAAKDRLAASAADIIDDRTEKKLKDKAGKVGKDAGDKLAEELLKALQRLNRDVNKTLADFGEGFWKDWEKRLDQGWTAMMDKIREDQAARTKPMEDAAAASAAWNEQLQKTVDFLDQIGGKAGPIANFAALLHGVSSGDFSGVRGPLGAIVQHVGSMGYDRINPDTGQREIRLLRDDMKGWFDENGTLIKALQGAGLGVAGAQLIFGAGNTNIGAAIGGGIAGAFAKDVGSSIASAIGKDAGKIFGKIAEGILPVLGGIAGNLLGSLFSSTPRGSATFNSSGLVSTRGNSNSRIAGASAAGRNALDIFEQLLDQLGATASGINFSAGIRKKNFVLDPSGQGRTKGAGVLNFGQDEEAFMKALLQEIISDATFEGLSEGFNNYLKNGAGDIADRIQDVLGLKGALDELKSLKDPQGFALEGLDKEFAKLREIAQATGEGLAEIEELYGLKRKEIVDRYAQEALEKENALKEMRVTILQLEGKQVEALALAREIELSTMSEAEQVLARRIHQLQDEAVAAAEAARVAEERKGLEIRLAEALGNEEEALRLRREEELAAVSELNRALLQQIHATEDAAAAAAKMAQAQAQAISQVQSAAGIVAGGGGGGNILGALNDPILGAGVKMMLQGFSAQQAAGVIRGNVAAQAAKAFPNDPVRQQGFIADFETQIAAGRNTNPNGVTNAELYGFGNPGKNLGVTQAFTAQLAAKREQRAAEAAQREEERLQREEDLRNRLADAYERESRALQDLIDQWSEVSKTLKDYRQELRGQIQSPLATFRSAQIALMQAAGSKDAEELSKLPGLGRDFLELALKRSSTLQDYRKHVMFVDQQIAQAEGFANDQVDVNERQLDALNRSVDGQLETNKKLETVAELLRELNAKVEKSGEETRQLNTAQAVAARKTEKLLDHVTTGGDFMRVGPFG